MENIGMMILNKDKVKIIQEEREQMSGSKKYQIKIKGKDIRMKPKKK